MPKSIPVWSAEWVRLKDNDILRVAGSDYAALPVTGKKSAVWFAIFKVSDLVELTQVNKKEVRTWLAKAARDENVKPTGYVSAATRIAPRKKGIVTPQIKPLGKNPRRRRNPVGSQRRAVNLYMDFHGENPRHVDEHFIDVPENAVMVGMVTGVMYQARVDGKLVEYVHEFTGKSRPILAASADGKQLLFLDGDYDFTDRGIIDGTASIN